MRVMAARWAQRKTGPGDRDSQYPARSVSALSRLDFRHPQTPPDLVRYPAAAGQPPVTWSTFGQKGAKTASPRSAAERRKPTLEPIR